MKPFLRMTELTLNNQRVFIRSDLNVPLSETGAIADDTRILASLPAIKQALQAGAAVMVTSHLGRPQEGVFSAANSLQPIADRLAELLARPVPLVRDWMNGVDVQPGSLVLLENCRFNVGEKTNDSVLAQKMASLCDIYVNDAFGTAHRAEASTEGIAHYAKTACAGPLLAAELDALGKVLHNPARPLVAIVGGSKVSTKLSVLRQLAAQVDQLIVGGGIANTFLAAAGFPIGSSLVEVALIGEAKAVMALMAERGAEVPLPIDVVTAKEVSASTTANTKKVNEVVAGEMILDIGPQTAQQFARILHQAGTIIWNGPVGVFELEQFSAGTKAVANAVADSAAFSLAGGGDTLAAIAKYGVTERIDYLSTGGGAFLEFLEGRVLPAVSALQERTQ